jgi:hypothetical protein
MKSRWFDFDFLSQNVSTQMGCKIKDYSGVDFDEEFGAAFGVFGVDECIIEYATGGSEEGGVDSIAAFVDFSDAVGYKTLQKFARVFARNGND